MAELLVVPLAVKDAHAARRALLRREAGVVPRLGLDPRLGLVGQRHAHTDNAPRVRGRFRGRGRVRVGVRVGVGVRVRVGLGLG